MQKKEYIPLKKADDDGKPGESLGETSTEELTQTHSDLMARLKEMGDSDDAKPLQARHEAIVAELKRRGKDPMGKGCSEVHKGGVVDLEDWLKLEKARGHKYISRKRVGDHWVYEYRTPGGQTVSVPSRGAARGEAPPAKPEPKEKPSIKESMASVQKVVVATPKPKKILEAAKELKTESENDKVFGLANQVLGAAIDKQDRKAAVKACRALIELARQPGKKGEVLKVLRGHLKDARASARTMQGRYNVDSRREKPVQGRPEWTFDHVLAARGIRDLIDRARAKTVEQKVVRKEKKPKPVAPVAPISETKKKARDELPAPPPIKTFAHATPITRVTEDKLESYPDGKKLQWTADGRLNEAEKKRGRWHHKVDGERWHEVTGSEGLASKIGDKAARLEGEAPKSAAAKAVAVLDMAEDPYINNAKLRNHIERASKGNKKAATMLMDNMILDGLDFYSDVGTSDQRKKLLQTAMSMRGEDILDGVHTDGDPRLLASIAVTLAGKPGGTHVPLGSFLRDMTTPGERAGMRREVNRVSGDLGNRSLVENELARIEQSEKAASMAKPAVGGISIPLKAKPGKSAQMSLDDPMYSNEQKLIEATRGWWGDDHTAAAKAHRAAAKEKGGSEGKKHRHVANAHAAMAKWGKDRAKYPGTAAAASPFGVASHLDLAEKVKKSMNLDQWQSDQEPLKKEDNQEQETGKSMGGLDGSLDDWMEKAGMPTHEARMGGPKSDAIGGSQDGGDLDGKGKTADSNGGATDAAGTQGAPDAEKEKLSEDDEDEGEIGKPGRKKPIETIGKSDIYPAPLTPARQRDQVAYELAVEASKLRKGPDMVHVGPGNHPFSDAQTMGSDLDAMSKAEGSTDIPSMTVSPGQSVAQSQILCKSVHAGGCDSMHSAMLTACPDCGAGTVEYRVLPSRATVDVVPTAGPQGLRPAKRDPLVVIKH